MKNITNTKNKQNKTKKKKKQTRKTIPPIKNEEKKKRGKYHVKFGEISIMQQHFESNSRIMISLV